MFLFQINFTKSSSETFYESFQVIFRQRLINQLDWFYAVTHIVKVISSLSVHWEYFIMLFFFLFGNLFEIFVHWLSLLMWAVVFNKKFRSHDVHIPCNWQRFSRQHKYKEKKPDTYQKKNYLYSSKKTN